MWGYRRSKGPGGSAHGPYTKPKRNAGSAGTRMVFSIIEGTFNIRCFWGRLKARAPCQGPCEDIRQRPHFVNN